MFDVPKPKTENSHESIWDHHGSYQWTYFGEPVKQRISFFLSQRLIGKNLEVGGGWYLSYPHSTVVDLSSVCLDYNPAKEKLQFDLDTIGKGNKLPYENNSFNSATLISVFQYLAHPKEVLRELERVIIPGGEVYIINGQGAGLDECIVGNCNTDGINRQLKDSGFDTIVEHIPSYENRREVFNVEDFQSICVAMPDYGLFGNMPSIIKNKEQRMLKDKEICEDPTIFEDAFKHWEFSKAFSKFSKLSTFPVTKYSKEYLERVEAFSLEYNKITGNIPLIFIEHGFEPEVAMLTSGNMYIGGYMSLMGEDLSPNARSKADELLKKFDVRLGTYWNYFKPASIKDVLDDCKNFVQKKEDPYNGVDGNEHTLRTYISFIASIALNSFACNLQGQMYGLLLQRVPDLDEKIEHSKALGYYFATAEHKQRRRIDKLIELKANIYAGEFSFIGERKLEFVPLAQEIKKCIE
jgi:hypothetical protein